MPWVSVNVNVSDIIGDIDDDTLLDECRNRDLIPDENEGVSSDLADLLRTCSELMKANNTEHLYSVLREAIWEKIGKIV